METYLYLIEQAGSGYVKIGISNSPKRRLQDLQIANPYPLVLRYTIRCNGHTAALIESELHQRFDDRNQQGEWFHVLPEEVILCLEDRWDVAHISEIDYVILPDCAQYKIPQGSRHRAYIVAYILLALLSGLLLYSATQGQLSFTGLETVGYLAIFVSSIAGVTHGALVSLLFPSRNDKEGARFRALQDVKHSQNGNGGEHD